MADVRALLRNERASRRITHPHASYAASGALSCIVCNLPLKSESLWKPHLASTQHGANLRKMRAGQASTSSRQPSGASSKKRKASDDEDEEADTRKKAKSVSSRPKVSFAEDVEVLEDTRAEVTPAYAESPSDESTPAPAPTADTLPPTIDEDEWAAFEREVAAPAAQSSSLPAVLNSSATISAAPVTAEELAAKAREEASSQAKERREAEMEGEKEDAARQLEEEFDEMEELEARVRRLREKREALRTGNDGGTVKQAAPAPTEQDLPMLEPTADPAEESEEDDDDDDDWEGWHLK
jgi:zinc finger protein 830